MISVVGNIIPQDMLDLFDKAVQGFMIVMIDFVIANGQGGNKDGDKAIAVTQFANAVDKNSRGKRDQPPLHIANAILVWQVEKEIGNDFTSQPPDRDSC